MSSSDFLPQSPRPTGIFVADDMQVAVIQPALQARGIELGAGHTQIISCNNESPFRVGLSAATGGHRHPG